MVRESIRQAIEDKGMSQSRFARQLGMEASNFNAWLNGQRPLPYGTFIRTMNMLGLSVGPASVGFAYLPCEELPEIFLQQMRQTGIKVCNIVQATGIAQSVVSSFLTGARRMSTNNVEKTMEVLGLGIVRCTTTTAEAI